MSAVEHDSAIRAAGEATIVPVDENGLVRRDEVLGLTFTRKAAHELAARVEAALARAGLGADADDAGRPMIATYDSFAGELIGEHGLRIGAEPDLRLITGAVRHRLAAQVVNRWTGGPALSGFQPGTIIDRLL